MTDQISETMRHLFVHSSATLEHLKKARIPFEMEMAGIAARRVPSATIARLRTILDA